MWMLVTAQLLLTLGRGHCRSSVVEFGTADEVVNYNLVLM